MKIFAIVLENGFEIDIPKTLIEYLRRRDIDWQWYDMRQRFWTENREETLKYFSELPKHQLLVCSTVFDGYQQLELMVQLLYKLKHKNFTFKIMNGFLCNDLVKFYEYCESSICPNTKTYNDSPDKREKFKQNINKQFIEVLQAHNIFQIQKYQEDDISLKTLEDVKTNCYKY